MDLLTESAATFSADGRYRYTLTRRWNASGRPHLFFIMLNPSTADELNNDPTVERCQRRAARMGMGGFTVLNLFAFRATNPMVMLAEADPVGPANDSAIRERLSFLTPEDRVIVAWGAHGAYHGRDKAVLALLRELGVKPYALAVNLNGTPKHPLYVASAAEPREYPIDAA